MSRPFVLPPLRNWQDFEDLCLDLWRRLWNDPDAQKNGRTGQPQAGVDVFGRPDGGREWAGVQCKRFGESLTPKVVAEEVAKARTFEPSLSRYVIATTAPSDVHCQKAARKITEDGFPVTVVSWDEICHHLEEHPDLVEKYFGMPRPESRRTELPPTGYRCMTNRPEGFVERQELDEIRKKLCASDTPTVGITTALRGAGGFGKTTLAQALCYDESVRITYPDGILWTTIGDQASEVDRLSRVLNLIRWWTRSDPPHFDEVTPAAAHLREILSGRRVLVVVDDVWSPADVEPFRGVGAGLLVTTRMRETLPAGCIPVDVDAMRLGEAVNLLAAGMPGVEGLRPRFGDLARKLGEWPLLLKLVNRTLQELVREEGLGVEKALDEVGEALDQAGLDAFKERDSTEREKAVSRTLEVSFRRLSEEERRKYEALAIFPEDEDVPLQVVERLWSCSGFEARQLARRFYKLSLLLRLDLDTGSFRLHDVIRQYLIDHQGAAVSALHQGFLARSLPTSGNWADLPPSESYLWRWLPYHLVYAGQSETLRDFLLDIRFLTSRLRATDVNVVIGGFDHLPEDSELRTVQSAIRMSAHILARSPEQLAGQLLGRLPERDEAGKGMGWERLRQEAKEVQLLSGGAGLLPRRANLTPAGGPLLRIFEGHTSWVKAVAAVGEERAISGSLDGTVRLWDLVTGTCLRVLERRTSRMSAVSAVGEGWALLGSDDGRVHLWDPATGAFLRTFERHTGPVSAVSAVGEGRVLSGSEDRTVRLWDLSTGACLQTFEGHTGPVSAVTAVGEGRALSSSNDCTVRLWDFATGACVRIFKGHTGSVSAVSAVGQGWALSGSEDRTVRLWDLATGACVRIFHGHSGPVSAVGEGRALAASYNEMHLLDLSTGARLRAFKGHTSWIHAVTAVGEGRALSGSSDGRVHLWDLATGACLPPLKGDTGDVRAVGTVGEGRALSASDDRMHLWDLETGAYLRPFRHSFAVHAVAAVGEEQALSGSIDCKVRLWDLETGACLRAFEGHVGGVYAVSAVGKGRALSGSSDGTVRLWELETGACLGAFEGHTDWVRAVATVGERWALSGSDDRTVRLWDLKTGACLCAFEGHTGWVRSVAAVGERRALSGSSDHTVRLWDLATGACLRTFEGHTGVVHAVVAVGERRALSVSSGRAIRLWDLETGACLAVFTFDHPVLTVAVRNGIVITGDTGGNLHFLDLILPP